MTALEENTSTTNQNTTKDSNSELWHKVRRRRIYQITRFPKSILRELCMHFLVENTNSIEAIPKPPPTLNDVKDASKFELVTYLSKFFERCYLLSMDKNCSKENRKQHLQTLKLICTSFDEKFTYMVLQQCRIDNAKMQRQGINSNVSPERRSRSIMSTSNNVTNSTTNEISSLNTELEKKEKEQKQKEEAKRQKEKLKKEAEKAKRTLEKEAERKTEKLKRDLRKKRENDIDAAFKMAHDPSQGVMVKVGFQPDNNRYNGAVHARSESMKLTFNKVKQILPPWEKRKIDERLSRWEPFWEVKYDLSLENDGSGAQLAPVERFSLQGDAKYKGEKMKSCMNMSFTIPDKAWSLPIVWNRPLAIYEHGDYRLILRTLPLTPPKSTYKADTHTWPKGTFIQTNSIAVHNVKQRKQQSHDESLWKGNSYPLDVTSYCSDKKRSYSIQIASVECGETNPYGIQLAICQYNNPTGLLQKKLPLLPQISHEQAMNKAMKYIRDQTVSIDDSSNDEEVETSNTQNSFSLNCPMSMTPIEKPVRGKKCKHLQCFDLASFIHSNSFPSGRRWRCSVCDSILSVDDLVQCGLFTNLVKERAQINKDTGKDCSKVILYGDGKWRLEEVKKEFMTNEIRGGKRKESKSSDGVTNKKKKGVENIICL